MSETTTISGQTSERNLVAAIKKHKPTVVLSGKTYKIVDATQLGGGNPEPKADVRLITDNNKSIRISMKKPNFGFFESWMDEAKLRTMLLSVGMIEDEVGLIVKGLKQKAKSVTESFKFNKEVLAEYNAMMSLVPSAWALTEEAKNHNKFRIKDFSISDAKKTKVVAALLNDTKKRFGSVNIKSTFSIENVYVPLNQLLGSNYIAFLETVIGGGEAHKRRKTDAQYVIVETVERNITSAQLKAIIEKAEPVSAVINQYSLSDDVNLKFRLRPITVTRAIYSATNAGKYRKGASFYADDKYGVSWTVHVTR